MTLLPLSPSKLNPFEAGLLKKYKTFKDLNASISLLNPYLNMPTKEENKGCGLEPPQNHNNIPCFTVRRL